ncbi:lytic transglycosylase domain-containing protein [Desulfomonile tiedjei]|uniref:Soluble lytic murein transglycosylase-like protein n=1 Tax=Desulfomonile tiedjei (strain ATCC 49306 / DSM 6799 / DCB-1) TaxID=706587 RepID=I4C146_DESTA|nr:lytic transglycosylase domain-containing protein [Desulfomonile tiedjei]AFM23287.1 soluble lytic murein transglycosylase-like protein [Desulfomonile tiedjei DSM 6799]
MIWHGLICFSLSSVIMTSWNETALSRPELSRPRASFVSLEVRRSVEDHLRLRELEKLEAIVASLGGKPHYAKSLLEAGREFQIDPVLLTSLTFVESSFRPNAASGRGAKGMMQLRPIVLEVLGVTDPWDPHENIMAGAAYLRHCFERYGKYKHSTYLALAAYNVGPAPQEKLLESEPARRFVGKVLQIYNRHADKPILVMPRPPRLTSASARNS